MVQRGGVSLTRKGDGMGERGSNRRPEKPSVGNSKRTTVLFFLVATFALMALLSVPFSRFVPLPGRLPRAIDRGLTPLVPIIPPLLGQAPGGKSQVVLGVGIRGSALLSPLRLFAGPAPSGPATKDKGGGSPDPIPFPDPKRGHSFGPLDRGGCAVQDGHESRPEAHEGHEGHEGHQGHESPGARKGVSGHGSHGRLGSDCGETRGRPERTEGRVQDRREAKPCSVASRTRSSGGTGSLKRKP